MPSRAAARYASFVALLLLTPSAAAGACSDDPAFRSAAGLGCAIHRGLDCRYFANEGLLTLPQTNELLARCPRACGGCPSEPAPGGPLRYPTAAPESAPAAPCSDDPAFRSAVGARCAAHRGLDCRFLSREGLLTPSEADELVARCPRACGECAPKPERGGRLIYPAAAPVAGACSDDLEFRSAVGLGCEVHRGLDCRYLSREGLLTPSEADELVARCPRACGRCALKPKRGGRLIYPTAALASKPSESFSSFLTMAS